MVTSDETPDRVSRHRSKTGRRRFLGIVGASAVLFAGCSGGDTTSTDTTETGDHGTTTDETGTLGTRPPDAGMEATMTPTGTRSTASDTPTGARYDTAYVGTYTDSGREGIYRCQVDRETGTLEQVGTTDAGENPSFLATHPTGEYIYAVNEVDPGTVTAFEIGASGALTLLNRVENDGEGGAHVSVDESGSCLLVSDYHGGVLSVVPINEDGSLDEPSQVLEHGEDSHVHAAVPGPDNEVAYVAALGLDAFFVYDLDPGAGRVEEIQRISLRSGAGPRNVDVHPDGSVVYLLCEQNSTLVAFERKTDGTLSEIATVGTLPDGVTDENYTAEVQVHDSGEFLFASNRGYDTIATFDIDDAGRPEIVSQTSTRGDWPRHFAMSPAGTHLFVENQHSNEIQTFRIGESGALEWTGNSIEIPQPVCMTFGN